MFPHNVTSICDLLDNIPRHDRLKSYPRNCVHPSLTNGKGCCLLKTRNHAEVLEVRTQSLKLNPMENLRMFTTQKNTVEQKLEIENVVQKRYDAKGKFQRKC